MSKYCFLLPAFFVTGIFLSGCIGSKLGSAKQKENLKMKIVEKENVIDYAILQQQEIPSLASRGSKSRAAMGGLAGTAVSLATNAIKQMIANDKKKYTAEYKYVVTDLYFYDQLSKISPFDPVGLQFNGFRLVRTFQNEGRTDTALIADFELDLTNPYEVINNSVFRLRLKDFKLNYAKAKVAAGSSNTLNMDFEISFKTSYVNADGELFRNVELGKFFLFIRNAPLDKRSSDYASYFERLKGKKLEGHSFIVPRSFGYHIAAPYATEPAFSQGAYTIDVKVRESSKNSFVNQLIIDNSGKLVDVLEGQLKQKLK